MIVEDRGMEPGKLNKDTREMSAIADKHPKKAKQLHEQLKTQQEPN